MERSAGYARCRPSAWRQNRVRDERCNCTRRKRCYSRPVPCSKVKPLPSIGSAAWWSTGWRGWSSSESVRPPTSAASKPVPVVPGRHGGQPDPGARQSRHDGRKRLRPSQRRQSFGRRHGHPRLRVARANLDPHFARFRLTDQIPLPDKGVPARFLEVASRSTDQQDAVEKRTAYAGLRIPEYWRFDETGEFHGTRLAGDRLGDGRYEPSPLRPSGKGI